jgi:5'-3' exonuclease
MNYTIIKKVIIKPNKMSKSEQKKKEQKKIKNKSEKKTKSSEPIDFHPFDIYPNDMQKNKPILLVDLGYATFYRFNATKTWYKHSHPDEKEEYSKDDYEWADNNVFMEKFNQQYWKCINELANKFKIPAHNVILAQDCSSCDNWRNDIYGDYKLTRKEQRDKCGFDGAKIFKYAFTHLFKALCKNYGFKLFKHEKIEADDINAIITQYYQQNFPKLNVYIVASDKDYLQLSNGYLHLIDFKGRLINDKEKDIKNIDGSYQLWHKIIFGDKSDNIPPLKIQRQYIRPKAKSGLDGKINATKGDANTLATDWKKFLKDVEKNPDLIDNKQLEMNKHLIDFNYIPKKYAKPIVKQLEEYLDN